jgi:hypothetical protein
MPTSSVSSVGKGPVPTRVVYGLDDAEHVVEQLRADARAGRRRAGDAVRARHVRIGAVVDVQQRALRALEQQRVALLARLMDEPATSAIIGASSFASASVSSRVVAKSMAGRL